ncbi:MAG: heme-copper oxidase subunit III [Deltaproteobacteria bacterium]|nr:heme-copper oxidase subunit III [Deltaproteobacteria bacterium]
MAREATARKVVEPREREVLKTPSFGGGPPPPSINAGPAISNARLGVFVFLGAEVMFFAGLIGAFMVYRLGSEVWPPLFQPRLPVAITGVNTVILLCSGVTVYLALSAIRVGRSGRLLRWLLTTVFLGAVFLSVQGYEWLRLIRFGLTVSSGVYGATFYTLIGFHGLHVLGAMLWLLAVLAQGWRGRFTSNSHTGVEVCAIYWVFVVVLWPVLYGLVYLY